MPFYKGELDKWDYVGFGFLSLVTFLSYSHVMSTKELYGSPEYFLILCKIQGQHLI